MILPSTLLVIIAPASAGAIEEAEHRRLVDEMRSYATRSQWAAVEEGFTKLEALEAAGVALGVEELQLGAQAARAAGDIGLYAARLERAARAGGSPEVITALEDLQVSFGAVSVRFDPKFKGERKLVPAVAPFAPDHRAAIDHANSALAAGAGWAGLLPVGEYTAGATVFVVKAGADPPVRVAVAPVPGGAGPVAPAGEPYRLAYAGPRVAAGFAYTRAGGLTDHGSSAEAGLQAAPFGGAGARVGVGLELGFTATFGVLAEVGYHNLVGVPRAGGERLALADGTPIAANSFHFGYGWLAGVARVGEVELAAGPLWGAGGARVTGVAGSCVGAGGTCFEGTVLETDDARYQPVSGRITAGGAAAALGLGLFDLGGLRGGVVLQGGAQSDTYRWYPWAQLGFAITPRTGGDAG